MLPLEQVRGTGLLVAPQSWHMAVLGTARNLAHTLGPPGVLQHLEQGCGTGCLAMGFYADLLWLRVTCSRHKAASLVGAGLFVQVAHLAR